MHSNNVPVVSHEVPKPLPHRPGIEHRFGGAESFAHNHHESFLWIKLRTGALDVDWVNIREKFQIIAKSIPNSVRFSFQAFMKEFRPQVAASNSDANYVAEPLAGVTLDFTAVNLC